MRSAFSVISISICLALAACSTAPPRLNFAKSGISPNQREQDSANCWKYAMESREGKDEANMVNGARVLGGGLFAVAMMASEEDPKKDMGNWSTHASCMQRKGYKPEVAD